MKTESGHLFILSCICMLMATCGYTQKMGAEAEVHISQFGARGDGKTNDTRAFQLASAYLQQYGGTLIIDSGTYILGKQTLSGRFGAGFSWKGESILNFEKATKPIIIIGKQATLKAADGLKYGSFNPITGKEDNQRAEGHPSNYYASAYIFINAVECLSVKIRGLTIDGNLGHLVMSKEIDKGIQLPAIGIRLVNNKSADIADCYIHHCGLDGVYIAWNGLTDQYPEYPHTLDHVVSNYNGRQGLSWVGGNSLKVTNSEFSHTGKAVNAGKQYSAAPAAGIDIEIQNSIIKNGYFENCIMSDNTGYGIVSIGEKTNNINFRNCTFIGTTNDAAFPKSENFSFDSCTFVGRVVGVHGDKVKSQANYFRNCLFSMDTSLSPGGMVYGLNSAFYDATNIVFDSCVFDAGTRQLPRFNQKEILFNNCTFKQNSNSEFRAIATFKGTTQFIMKGGARINAAESDFDGPVIYNGNKARNKQVLNIMQSQLN